MDDVVFLYDQTIEHIVRLHAFRSMVRGDLSGNGDVHDDVDHVADLLAKRDLLTFAASLRNFAEAAKAVQSMRESPVKTVKLIYPPQAPFSMNDGKQISLYQALSRVIHSHTLRVCRSSFDFWLIAAKSEEELYSAATQQITPSEPLLIIQTEKDPVTAFSLRTLIDTSCGFLDAVRSAPSVPLNFEVRKSLQ
ncbi:MAG: hypothetical protein JWP84_5135 [Tardiphaga sp.]|jgi:hypothetical protein|nr:hypothetical protein [Tardiphaga sp.]